MLYIWAKKKKCLHVSLCTSSGVSSCFFIPAHLVMMSSWQRLWTTQVHTAGRTHTHTHGHLYVFKVTLVDNLMTNETPSYLGTGSPAFLKRPWRSERQKMCRTVIENAESFLNVCLVSELEREDANPQPEDEPFMLLFWRALFAHSDAQ